MARAKGTDGEAGMRTKLDTKGIRETLEEIARLGLNVDLSAWEALDAGGSILLDGMQQRVPRLTGNLADNLEKTEPKQDGNTISLEVGLSRGADKRTAIYGTVQEYGSSNCAAQPYIRPTIDNDMKDARKAMIEVLSKKMAGKA
jgi:HK97 gp10 family phage protein